MRVSKYVYFFIAARLAYALYSILLDVSLTSAHAPFRSNLFGAFAAYLMVMFIYDVPCLVIYLFYNLVSREALKKSRYVTLYRFLFALIYGSLVGYLLGETTFSLYIGEYRSLKNLVLFPAVFITMEVLRYMYSQNKLKRNAVEVIN